MWDSSGSDWATFGVADTQALFDDVVWVCKQMAGQDDVLIQDPDGLRSLVRELRQFAEQVESFSFRSNHNKDHRDAIQGDLRSATMRLVNEYGSLAAIWALQRSSSPSGQARRELEKMGQVAEEMGSLREEALKTAEGIRQAAAESGAEIFTKEFDAEARKCAGEGKDWVRGAAWMAGVTVLIVLLLVLFDKPSTTGWESLYGIGTRFFGLSVLFYAIVWCGRMGLAKAHLSSVNRHRALSITTLVAFRGAAKSEQAKDAVTIEAARAVYGHVPTGLVTKDVSEGPASRTLEVMRPFVPASE